MNCRDGGCILCSALIIFLGIFLSFAGLSHILITQDSHPISGTTVLAPAIFLFVMSALFLCCGCSCLCRIMVEHSREEIEDFQMQVAPQSNTSFPTQSQVVNLETSR